jgi:glycosyltransferase involved in cell wall biosynthesis
VANAVHDEGGIVALATLPYQGAFDPERTTSTDFEWALTGSRLQFAQQAEGLSTFRRIAAHMSDLNPRCGGSELTKVLGRFQPTVIVTNNVRGLGVGVLRACSEFSAPWIHIPHDVQLLVPSGLWPLTPDVSTLWDRPAIRAPYMRWMRSLVSDVDAVMAPTEFMLRAHRDAGFFEKSVPVVQRLPMYTDPSGKLVLPPKTLRPSDAPVRIAMIGRLSRHKGFVWALDALRSSPHQLHITICGAGEDCDDIVLRERSSTHNVKITHRGQVSPKQRAEVLALSDLLLIPSLVHENGPLVIEEAFEAGVPVVASRSGGIPELIEARWIFRAGDTGDLQRVLAQFIAERPHETHTNIDRPTAGEYARALLDTVSALRSG